MTPPRLVPEIPFPPYTYVPGRAPHPFSHPAGHRFGHDLPPAEPVTADNWRYATRYLLGIDLYNAGYYWEAHEQWESLWHAHGRRGPEATFFKALIQLAVAGVKRREGRDDGATAHASRAAELFRDVMAATGERTLFGLDVEALAGERPA
jgi:hypothetical protein